MVAGREDRASLWIDGRLTVRLRGPGPEPGRIIRVRKPFALIGQVPGADIRIDDALVDGRHALLLLDRRGVFGVDLRSRSGTRFAGGRADSSRLGPGDILEIAGHRVELLEIRVDGLAVDPPLADDDLLGDAPHLVGLTLEPIGVDATPWMLGSALAFVGRGEACAIRVEHASASQTHCALLRDQNSAYVIDLLGCHTSLNDDPVQGASALVDGDVLTVGQARFAVRLEGPSTSGLPAILGREGRAVATDPRGVMVAMLAEAMGTSHNKSIDEIVGMLRDFRGDVADLLEAQFRRIETLHREVAGLRDELRGHLGPLPEPAEPLQLDLTPPKSPPSGESASWLLGRLDALEAEGRTARGGLLARLASAVTPRSAMQPSQSLQPLPPRDA
jgi:pSer/pThr/pTyr-binding forkhead associated (FHA) protein